MINLLSPTDKKILHAARRNTIWSRYTLIIVFVLIAVNIILFITIFFIQSQAHDYETRVATNEDLTTKQYKDTKTKADAFRQDLATAKVILGGETNYSTILVSIAKTTPSNCVLASLALNNQFFNTPQTLSFNCTGPPDILRLKTALEQNTQYFDKVNIVTTTGNTPPIGGRYFITITMSLLLKKPSSTGVTGS